MRTSVLQTTERGVFDMEARILPTQYYATKPHTGEQRLCAAVLEDALATYQKAIRDPGAYKGEAEREAAWLFSDATEDAFAFVRVCQAVGLEPDDIRRRLAAWVASGLPAKSPYQGGVATAHHKVVLLRQYEREA